MRMRKENLKVALSVAVREQMKRERQETRNPKFESSMVRGWRDVLEAIERGEGVDLVK